MNIYNKIFEILKNNSSKYSSLIKDNQSVELILESKSWLKDYKFIRVIWYKDNFKDCLGIKMSHSLSELIEKNNFLIITKSPPYAFPTGIYDTITKLDSAKPVILGGYYSQLGNVIITKNNISFDVLKKVALKKKEYQLKEVS